MNQETYLKERVEEQIEWYSRKAALNKSWYIRLEIISIVLSVSIPFVSNFMTAGTPWIKHVVSLMGVLIAGISGLVGLMKYRDNWVEYRTTAELLRHERYMFLTKSGAYATGRRFDLFVQTIENLLSSEIANWKNYQTAAPENVVETPELPDANAPTPTPEPAPVPPVSEEAAPAPEPDPSPVAESPAEENAPIGVENPSDATNPEDSEPSA